MSSKLVFLFFVLKFLLELQCDAQLLPLDEVRALAQIGRKLGADKLSTTRGDQQAYPWLDPKPDSCILNSASSLVFRERPGNSSVGCDCTFNENTTCHVTKIELIEYNLSGELPEEFADLPFLSKLDLSYNYIKGSIPRRWASLPLTHINIAGNLIGGPIPKELGNVTTLSELNLVDNLIGGQLPPALGNLNGLKMFLLSGNNFSGVLPNTFGNLKNLIDFRIDGSTLSGRIPEFIGNWTTIRRLNMQGTSLQGPIPSSISSLTNLEILRISDLDVENMSFPNLRVLTKLNELVLRNCSIIGQIPSYIGENMRNMKNLDLSFNRLNGAIPESLGSLINLEHMYLTNNGLSGEIQSWLQETNFTDVSYNNFTGNPGPYNCRTDNRNQISSYAALNDNSIPWCLKKDPPCPTNPNNFELFINCGGPRMSFEDREYEEDEVNMGPSSFYSNDKWASSTTGYYHPKSQSTSKYFANRGDPSIYSTARRAPLSVKYYGRCLQSGIYTLKLHFAEIMLTADRANNIRGRRIFDVYVQGNKVITGFNIAKEAGGIDISAIKEFNVKVTSGTLEIHLQWSGKGTIDYAPFSSVYGPLISAITLTPNFKVSSGDGVSAGAVSGIVIGSVGGVILILVVIWKLGYLGGKDNELRGLELQTGYYTLRQIKAATGNFDLPIRLVKVDLAPFTRVYSPMVR